MNELALEYLDWDSEQLGVSCGLINGVGLENLPEPVILVNQIKYLCEEKKNIKFITIKLPGSSLEAVNVLVKMGAFLMDTELTFSYSMRMILRDCETIPDTLKFVFCEKCNSRSFIPLAKEMRLSRFFCDPKIPKDRAIHLWETSIKNHCEGFSDQLLIAYHNDDPCGIITLKFSSQKVIFLHIVGILKQFQGKHIGQYMLKKIAERYAADYTIYVETQSDNIPAYIVYQKSGFKYHALKYILHYWQ